MGHVDIVIEKKESKRSSTPFLALLFLVVGVYGILLFFQSIPGIAFMVWVVYLVPAVLCAALWYSYFYRKRLFPFLVAATLAICIAAAFLMGDVLPQQFAFIAGSISGKTGLETIPVTELMLLLAVFISVVLFLFEVILHNHVILFSLVTGVLLLAPLFGIRPGIGAVVLLVFFLITFWALHLPGRGTESPSLGRKSMRAAAVILAVSLLAAFPLVCHYIQELYSLAFEAEGFVYRTANRLSGRDSEPITGGKVHGGNNYRTGTGHLELTVSGQPTETLYLRGFGGGEYIGGDWIRSSDEELFPSMEEKLDWQEWGYRINSMYYGMYFVMNSNMQNEGGQMPFSLRVRHLNGEYGNAYVPYYSQRVSGWNSVSGNGAVRDGYVYQYFEQSAMDIKWDNVSADFEQSRDRYMELRDAYMEEIKTAYTQVPVELLPRLKKLVEENPMDGLNEISAFILYTLHSNASYTLTPGWAPFNEDIAEYFLFEGGQGYCEHFALAATLMYRMYGIPARYATGYMVQPSAFEMRENVTWQAVVTDEDAHAWTEIFLEDYGWTPVEVTPAADGSTVANYPGFDSIELGRLLSVKNWNMDMPSLQQGFSLENDTGTVQDLALGWKFDIKKHQKLLWIAGTVLIYSLLLIPFFLNYRRLRHLEKVEDMNCRRVFYKLMQMLHFAGYFKEYDGSEKEFVSVFTEEIPVISVEEIAQLQNIVCEAAYGFRGTAIEKEELVKNIYFRAGSFIYGKLKWNRKLLFRYWHMFG